ncbi:uncharacterized protein LOC131214570 [Anopheles bellator]|uniref:uncharacterized protein LOC131214570 n=1 Tax=Anopheles bellator TaxID=139047 RepID=UPI002647DBE6|nr:uncharacterized protein LOC131214570 [Anopheles bellator]
MADLRIMSHEFLSEFITLYESLPCLWQVKNKDYSDRDKKAEAYDALIAKYKGIDPTCTKEIVTKKIHNLRTVYRKESEKVRESATSGSAADQIYKPSLWYYDMLHFLQDQETPRVSKNTMEDSGVISTEEETKKANNEEVTEVIKIVGRKLQSMEDEDDFWAFAKHVAYKLRSISSEQCAFAQKLIGDVLLEVELGTLTRNFALIEYTSD